MNHKNQHNQHTADIKVLVVHPDLEALSALQHVLAEGDASPVVARDLPTALLAATQHYFHAAIISSRVSEEGDGWPLAGILRRVFPHSFVAVIAPGKTVLTLQAAINHGLNSLFEASARPEEIARATLAGAHGTTVRHP